MKSFLIWELICKFWVDVLKDLANLRSFVINYSCGRHRYGTLLSSDVHGNVILLKSWLRQRHWNAKFVTLIAVVCGKRENYPSKGKLGLKICSVEIGRGQLTGPSMGTGRKGQYKPDGCTWHKMIANRTPTTAHPASFWLPLIKFSAFLVTKNCLIPREHQWRPESMFYNVLGCISYTPYASSNDLTSLLFPYIYWHGITQDSEI